MRSKTTARFTNPQFKLFLNSNSPINTAELFISLNLKQPRLSYKDEEKQEGSGCLPHPSPVLVRRAGEEEQGGGVFLSSLSLGLRGNSLSLEERCLYSPSSQLELTQVGGEGPTNFSSWALSQITSL